MMSLGCNIDLRTDSPTKPGRTLIQHGLENSVAIGETELKYDKETLVPMFRKAAALRNEMLSSGFTDNGGAIHSAERILDILGRRLQYPKLSHINNLRDYPRAEFSIAALAAHERGEKVFIEHVSPTRALTRCAIAVLDQGASDQEFIDFVKQHYRLVLLTRDETKKLNRHNRSKMVEDRLGEVGIQVCRRSNDTRL